MKTEFKFLIVLLASVLVGLGCTKDESPTGPGEVASGGVIWPLTTGNYWAHRYNDYQNDTLLSSRIDTMSLSTPKTWNGKQWFGLNGDNQVNLRNASDGLYQLYFENDTTGITFLWYKYPVSVGESYQVSVNDSVNVTCMSISETVTVPAGTFTNCIKYRFPSSDGSHTRTDWISPNVGPIQFEVVGNNADGNRTMCMLTSWHLIQ